MKLQAAIFDLDGTLLDSMGVWEAVDVEFLGRRGIAMPDDYSAALALLGYPAAADYTKARFSLPETPTAIMREWDALALDAYRSHVVCRPHVKEYLCSLAEKNIPIAAATASRPEYFMPALVRCGVDGFFSSFTEVAEVARGKGFPDIYLRAAEKLGTPPENCAVFEDITAGLCGARAGGFFCVGVYEPHNREKERMQALSDRYINDFSELLSDDIFGKISGISE